MPELAEFSQMDQNSGKVSISFVSQDSDDSSSVDSYMNTFIQMKHQYENDISSIKSSPVTLNYNRSEFPIRSGPLNRSADRINKVNKARARKRENFFLVSPRQRKLRIEEDETKLEDKPIHPALKPLLILKTFIMLILQGKHNAFGLIMNSMNGMIGLGIISLPFLAQDIGINQALIVAFICTCLMSTTCFLLTAVSISAEERSYSFLVKSVLGNGFYVLHIFCGLLLPIMTCITYGILIVDNIQKTLQVLLPSYPLIQNPYIIISIVLTLMVFPLSIPKKISFISRVSMASLLIMLVYVSLFLYKLPEISLLVLIFPPYSDFGNRNMLQSIGAFILSFTIHHNFLILLGSFHDCKLKTTRIYINLSFAFTLLLYSAVIIVTVFSFRGIMTENIFDNYFLEHRVMLCARMLFTLSIIITYPQQVYASRDILFVHLHQRLRSALFLKIAFSLVILFICGAITSLTERYGLMIKITGCLLACPMTIIFPSLLYLYKNKIESQRSLRTFILWSFVFLGIIIMIVGTCGALVGEYFPRVKVDFFPQYWLES